MRGVYTRIVLLFLIAFGGVSTALAQVEILVPFGAPDWRYSITDGDQGTDWRQLNFDDSAWAVGTAPLGFPAGENILTLGACCGTVFPANPNPTQTTTYYRKTFNFAGNPAEVSLIITNATDDGHIVFLNGEELGRFRIPDGLFDFTTFSTVGEEVGDHGFDRIVIPGGDLIPGMNVIAIELKQGGGTPANSSDLIMETSVAVVSEFGPVDRSPGTPADTTILQGRSGTLTSTFAGFPSLTYQWLFNPGGGAMPLLDATNSSLTISNMSAAQAGEYFVQVTGFNGTVESRHANVGFEADLAPPVPQQARWDDDLSVLVQFDEQLLGIAGGGGSDDPFGYNIQFTAAAAAPGGGGGGMVTWTVGNVILVNNDTAVILTNLTMGGSPVMRDPAVNYTLRINGFFVGDDFFNTIDDDTLVAIASQFIGFDWDAEWRFDQSGADLGTAWTAPAFDDSAWSAGPGALGTEPNLAAPAPPLPPIRTPMLTTSAGGPITIYLRKKFVVPVALADILEASIEILIDDGAVVHLNGVEVYRQDVPANQTFATGGVSHEADHIDVALLPVGSFQAGENTFAVEVHNVNATSSDIVMGLRVIFLVEALPTGPVMITTQPSDVSVDESGTAVFAVEAIGGAPISYQWQKEMVDLAGETGSALTINNVNVSHAGNYRVIVSNSQGPETSDTAVLTVTNPDLTGPLLLWAYGSVDLSLMTLAFNEGLDQASAETIGNYIVRPISGGGAQGGGAGSLAILSALLVNGTNVVLETDPRVEGVNYEVVVTGVRDDAFASNVITPNTTEPVLFRVTLVPIDETQMWRHDQSNVDPGADTWYTPGFDDSAWPEGPALFGAEGATLAFPILTPWDLTAPDGAAQTSAYYARTHFNYSGNPDGVLLSIEPIVDDGVAIYLNGMEVLRLGLTDGVPIAHADLASRTVGDAALEGPFVISGDQLQAGDNVLAITVHQVNLTSSDVVAGVWLDALIGAQGPPRPRLSARRLSNGDVEISWTAGPEWVLVSSATAKGTYTPVAGTPSSPVVVTPVTSATVYYQLRNNN